MRKLFRITLPTEPVSFYGDVVYFASSSMEEAAKMYPNAKRIEHISDNCFINSGDRYELLQECLNFIDTGANTFTLTDRINLTDKIKHHLNEYR